MYEPLCVPAEMIALALLGQSKGKVDLQEFDHFRRGTRQMLYSSVPPVETFTVGGLPYDRTLLITYISLRLIQFDGVNAAKTAFVTTALEAGDGDVQLGYKNVPTAGFAESIRFTSRMAELAALGPCLLVIPPQSPPQAVALRDGVFIFVQWQAFTVPAPAGDAAVELSFHGYSCPPTYADLFRGHVSNLGK